MSFPSFSVGEVLTAADMNAVGLWRITNCTVTSTGGTAATASNGVITVGSANTSVTINNAFNGDFLNYRVVVTNIDCSVSDTIFLVRPGAVATGNPYSSGGLFVLYSGTGPGYLSSSATNDGIAVGITSTDFTSGTFDILAPNTASWTRASGHWSGDLYTANYAGVMKTNTAYTSLEIRTFSGTMTGGTIRVYGYRN